MYDYKPQTYFLMYQEISGSGLCHNKFKQTKIAWIVYNCEGAVGVRGLSITDFKLQFCSQSLGSYWLLFSQFKKKT